VFVEKWGKKMLRIFREIVGRNRSFGNSGFGWDLCAQKDQKSKGYNFPVEISAFET
jgi:hypothetical protein